MRPNLIDFESITNEVSQLSFIQNSKYFNYILLVIFMICFTSFVLMIYYDTKKFTKKNTLDSLKNILKDLV